MKDNELRGILLQKFYEHRRSQPVSLNDLELNEQLLLEAGSICDQLSEHGLLQWRAVRTHGFTLNGLGKITATGIDVIEGEATASLAIAIDQSHNFSVHAPSTFQVGSHNAQVVGNTVAVDVSLGQIGDNIDNSTASDAQKAEAKSVIARAFEHPVVTTVLGTAVDSVVKAIFK